jgi:DNA polymerase-3 subunit alpha
LAAEKEVLGFYLASHPLAEHEERLATFCSHTTVAAGALANRAEVVLGGMLASLKFSHTKNPRPGSTNTKYVMFDLEDTAGMIRSIVWPEDFARCGHLVEPDAILVVRGVIDKRPGSEEANLIVNDLIPIDELDMRFTRGVIVRLQEGTHEPRHVEQLYEILRGYPGHCELQLVFALADGSKVICESDALRLSPNAEMRARVEELLGPGNFRLVASIPKASPRPANGAGRTNGFRRAPARA